MSFFVPCLLVWSGRVAGKLPIASNPSKCPKAAAYTIKKFKETQTVADKPKKGRPRTVRTKKLIKTTVV
jgi:hypothetical protein